jgi:uncharacterized protein YceH (UPF0502 family)
MTEAAWDTEGGVTRDRSAVLKSVRIGASCSRFTDRLKGSHCVKSIRSQDHSRITHFEQRRRCSEFTDFKASYAEGVTLFLIAINVPKS